MLSHAVSNGHSPAPVSRTMSGAVDCMHSKTPTLVEQRVMMRPQLVCIRPAMPKISRSMIHLQLAEASATAAAAASAAAAPTASVPAEAFKSIWRMLSLNKNKPAADAGVPDEEAAQRQISAQHALAREVSEPAVILAASDDQLQRPTDLPQQALSSDTGTDSTTAAAIPKQPSIIPKRFSFLNTLRRGSAAAESETHAESQLADAPETPADHTQAETAAALTDADVVTKPASLQGNAERITANPIELPPVFEYGSDADGSPQGRGVASATVVRPQVGVCVCVCVCVRFSGPLPVCHPEAALIASG